MTFPMYLVDDYPDGAIEQNAWVEVTDKTATPYAAVEWLNNEVEPDEDMRYIVTGQSYQRPLGVEVPGSEGELRTAKPLDEYPTCDECKGTGKFTEDDEEDSCDECYGTGKKGEFIFDSCEPIPWEACEADAPEAKHFWNIELTDDQEAPIDPANRLNVSDAQEKMDI